ncbi:hypothetical protein V5T82_07210 [Magnetovibrio sp. PR-2]|uniref:hypothetical protein n=1 Tax=Magnetovibrio sp. PR-2 TaxID=3120356 RepID=UPI002FCE0FF9
MWDVLNQSFGIIIAGGTGSVAAILLLLVVALAYVIRRMWTDRNTLIRQLEEMIQHQHQHHDEQTETLMALLDRYHEDRSSITHTLSDIKETLARIAGKLF